MTAPDDEALIYDIQKMRDLGYNMLRKHIKVEPARWYYHCDRLGMLVWQDMPNGCNVHQLVAGVLPNIGIKNMSDKFSGLYDRKDEQGRKYFLAELDEMMSALYNCVSICTWVPFNESWGQFDTPDVIRFTRALDPTRLINPASGGNFDLSEGIFGLGDVLDVHHYPHPAMNIFERKVVNVLGEYGGIGLPVEGHTWQIERKWGYGGTKKDSEEVMTIYESFLEMLKTLVQTGCAAAVYTQTTDVEGEVNGLITYDRKVIKVDVPRISKGNQSVINSMPAKFVETKK
jgi:hypothetical protein